MIAENGDGTIKFRVKTEFDSPNMTLIDPPEKVAPNIKTTINAFVDEQFALETVTLTYTTSIQANQTSIEMVNCGDKLYNATIPEQPAGTDVDYTVLARDTSGNAVQIDESYQVKIFENITLQLSNTFIFCGDTLTVSGQVPVSETDVQLNYALINQSVTNLSTLNYSPENASITNQITADSTGKFSDEPTLTKSGTWVVWATWDGTEKYFPISSPYQKFTYNKLLKQLTCNHTQSLAIGDNITVTGQVYPPEKSLGVMLTFISANGTTKRSAMTDINGTYTVHFKPDMMGLWQVTAQIIETATIASVYSNSTTFTVTDTFLNQYLMFIVGGAGGGGGIGAFVFIKKRREE